MLGVAGHKEEIVGEETFKQDHKGLREWEGSAFKGREWEGCAFKAQRHEIAQGTQGII